MHAPHCSGGLNKPKGSAKMMALKRFAGPIRRVYQQLWGNFVHWSGYLRPTYMDNCLSTKKEAVQKKNYASEKE